MFFFCVTFVLSIHSSLIYSQTVRNYRDTFIVNGQDASVGQFPYAVIVSPPFLICGGTILSERKVLTARHCVEASERKGFNPSQVFITVGTIYLSARPYTQATALFMHSEFDVAVIVVAKQFKFSDLVQPIALTTVLPKEGDRCVVSGFGALYFGSGASEKLQYVYLTIDNRQYCKKIYEPTVALITEEMICAGAHDEGDACTGDSGSGLICGGVVAGIVSFGINCGLQGTPGVYMSVYYFLEWIEKSAAVSLFYPTKYFIITVTAILFLIINWFRQNQF